MLTIIAKRSVSSFNHSTMYLFERIQNLVPEKSKIIKSIDSRNIQIKFFQKFGDGLRLVPNNKITAKQKSKSYSNTKI